MDDKLQKLLSRSALNFYKFAFGAKRGRKSDRSAEISNALLSGDKNVEPALSAKSKLLFETLSVLFELLAAAVSASSTTLEPFYVSPVAKDHSCARCPPRLPTVTLFSLSPSLPSSRS